MVATFCQLSLPLLDATQRRVDAVVLLLQREDAGVSGELQGFNPEGRLELNPLEVLRV